MKIKLNPIEKIYLAFYISKKKRMYFNEIKDSTKMSISSLQNALVKLDSNKEIERIKEKSNTFYTLKDKEQIILNFTKFDIQKLNNLNINIKIPIKEFTLKISNVNFILLFGSSSRNEQKKGSDIDLLVVLHHFENNKLNELYQKEIKKEIEEIKKKIDAKSLYHLSIVFIDEDEFKTRKDYLLDEAKKTGFCVYNHELYYKDALNEN